MASSLETGDSVNIDNLTVNFTVPGLNAGADTVNGDAGDDTIIWNANAAAPTDGRDIVNGGTEGAAGDTFVINGNASSETYHIYTLAAWDAVAGNDLASFGGARRRSSSPANGTGLRQCHRGTERNRGNPHQRRRADRERRGGAGAGDTFNVIGDFSATSLRLNTITIDGDAGDDTIDISALTSAHRIVFRSNGGNDTIIGTLRPEDVIELPDGADRRDLHLDDNAGRHHDLSTATASVTFTGVVHAAVRTDERGRGRRRRRG